MSIAGSFEKFMFSKAEAILAAALPDINEALNAIERLPGELKPTILLSFDKEEIFLTVILNKLVVKKPIHGNLFAWVEVLDLDKALLPDVEKSDEIKMIISRVWKKMKFSDLNEMIKQNEKTPKQIARGDEGG